MAPPGGNVTGFSNAAASLAGKWLQLLTEIDPRIARIGLVYGPHKSAEGGTFYLRLAERAANSLGMKIEALPVETASDATMTLLRAHIAAALGIELSASLLGRADEIFD